MCSFYESEFDEIRLFIDQVFEKRRNTDKGPI